MGQNANGLPAMPELTGGGFLDDVGQFLWLHLIEVLATTFELFESFDHGFGHATMCFLGATDDRKLIARGDSFVPVLVVESQAEQTGLGRRLW
jgi:hypothetical protein